MNAPDLYYSTDGELFNTDDLTELDLVDGQTYWQGERVEIKPSELISDYIAAQIIERMEESLFDLVGELSEDRLLVSDQQENELLKIVKAWADSEVKIDCWKIKNVKEMTFNEGWEFNL